MTCQAHFGHNSASFKKCDEYANDVLGSLKYAPWLKAYTVLAGTFKEGWIPNNYYNNVVVPKLKGNYGIVSYCRAISRTVLQTDLLPDLAYSVNGLLFTVSMETIEPRELKEFLFSASERVVYKADNAQKGTGIIIYNARDFPDETTNFGNGVFQRCIVQHPFFSEFSNNSVATIRITTVVDDKSDVSFRAAYLRLPRGGETHVTSSTAIKVVLGADGALDEKGYLPNWVPVAHHPDSKVLFANHIVPNFRACVQECISLHEGMRFARVVGWDVIIDSDGNVELMEWNGNYNGIKFSEAASGPCFADLGWQNLWRT